MASFYNRRCSLCGQFVIADRETLLQEDRHEWDEAIVDDFIAGYGHLCWESEYIGPNTAFSRQWTALADADVMRPELRWLIEAELERRHAAGRPAWVVFAGPAASIIMAAGGEAAMPSPRQRLGTGREGPPRVRPPAGDTDRSPP